MDSMGVVGNIAFIRFSYEYAGRNHPCCFNKENYSICTARMWKNRDDKSAAWL